MSKLKLGPLENDKPVKMSVELSAATHRDLLAYAETLGKETGRPIGEPAKLIAPMIERFMASDRGFSKLRRERPLKQTTAVLPKLPK
jgi:hypothetical protein